MASVIGWWRLGWVWQGAPRVKGLSARLISVGVPFLVVLALVIADVRVGPTPVDAMFVDGVVWPVAFIAAFFLTIRYYAPARPKPH
jgi:hypothetical protein